MPDSWGKTNLTSVPHIIKEVATFVMNNITYFATKTNLKREIVMCLFSLTIIIALFYI